MHACMHGMVLVLFRVHGLQPKRAREHECNAAYVVGPSIHHHLSMGIIKRETERERYKACTRHIPGGPGRAWASSRQLSDPIHHPSSVPVFDLLALLDWLCFSFLSSRVCNYAYACTASSSIFNYIYLWSKRPDFFIKKTRNVQNQTLASAR